MKGRGHEDQLEEPLLLEGGPRPSALISEAVKVAYLSEFLSLRARASLVLPAWLFVFSVFTAFQAFAHFVNLYDSVDAVVAAVGYNVTAQVDAATQMSCLSVAVNEILIRFPDGSKDILVFDMPSDASALEMLQHNTGHDRHFDFIVETMKKIFSVVLSYISLSTLWFSVRCIFVFPNSLLYVEFSPNSQSVWDVYRAKSKGKNALVRFLLSAFFFVYVPAAHLYRHGLILYYVVGTNSFTSFVSCDIVVDPDMNRTAFILYSVFAVVILAMGLVTTAAVTRLFDKERDATKLQDILTDATWQDAVYDNYYAPKAPFFVHYPVRKTL